MATTRPMILLDGVTDNTVGEWFPCDGATYSIIAEGGYGDGTVTLQTAHDTTAGHQDAYDEDKTLYELNAENNYVSEIKLKSSMSVRATLSDSTNPNLTIKLA